MMLYAIMLGGKHPSAQIEVHDVVFALGNSLEDTFEQLKQQWFGLSKGLHIDAWMAVDGVEDYQVKLHAQPPIPDNPKLYFINLGGYLAHQFGEMHHYLFLVANSKMHARGRARGYFKKLSDTKAWLQPHVDAVLDVDDCLLVHQVGDQFVHLVQGAHQGIAFENTYLLIG